MLSLCSLEMAFAARFALDEDFIVCWWKVSLLSIVMPRVSFCLTILRGRLLYVMLMAGVCCLVKIMDSVLVGLILMRHNLDHLWRFSQASFMLLSRDCVLEEVIQYV